MNILSSRTKGTKRNGLLTSTIWIIPGARSDTTSFTSQCLKGHPSNAHTYPYPVVIESYYPAPKESLTSVRNVVVRYSRKQKVPISWLTSFRRQLWFCSDRFYDIPSTEVYETTSPPSKQKSNSWLSKKCPSVRPLLIYFYVDFYTLTDRLISPTSEEIPIFKSLPDILVESRST